MNHGKCVKCDRTISSAKTESLKVGSGEDLWKGLSIICPYCHAILGIAIDPIALINDTAAAVVEQLRAESNP